MMAKSTLQQFTRLYKASQMNMLGQIRYATWHLSKARTDLRLQVAQQLIFTSLEKLCNTRFSTAIEISG